ncbi:hypothetical protein CIPAW_09G056300 [Carya illinoinensis]|uniref:Uncharacterized protein n=1 Tax=Carya illinoinensis TaxID=32201 RepID=A0A8T1PHW7_CARIL|nr:hypothetical protein CIPAW_09G056300 [Carya illinoinensis]KAG6641192.1 hypothetical protein CIPAW_09G056300 [Carya illinoinensis]
MKWVPVAGEGGRGRRSRFRLAGEGGREGQTAGEVGFGLQEREGGGDGVWLGRRGRESRVRLQFGREQS